MVRCFGGILDALLFPSDVSTDSEIPIVPENSKTIKNKSKRVGATPSISHLRGEGKPTVPTSSPDEAPRGRDVSVQPSLDRVTSPPPVKLSPFWLDHIDFFDFLSAKMPHLVATASDKNKSVFPLITDAFLPSGYYLLDASSLRRYDTQSKKFVVLRQWSLIDAAALPSFEALSNVSVGWFFR